MVKNLYHLLTRDRLLYITVYRAERRLLYGRTQYAHPSRFIDEMPGELLDSNIVARRMFASATQPDPDLPRAQVTRARSLSSASSLGMQTQTETPLPDFTPGCRVQHKAFGSGMVVSVKPMGGDALLEIAFDEKGTKRLMAKAASKFMNKA